jgi:hypothetical protein
MTTLEDLQALINSRRTVDKTDYVNPEDQNTDKAIFQAIHDLLLTVSVVPSGGLDIPDEQSLLVPDSTLLGKCIGCVTVGTATMKDLGMAVGFEGEVRCEVLGFLGSLAILISSLPHTVGEIGDPSSMPDGLFETWENASSDTYDWVRHIEYVGLDVLCNIGDTIYVSLWLVGQWPSGNQHVYCRTAKATVRFLTGI